MNTQNWAERLPPDMLWSEREPLLDDDIESPSTSSALSAVPSTLLIPLAARAHGDAMFPTQAVGDIHAARLLRTVGDARSTAAFLADRASVYGVLARTQIFRRLGLAFFERHPDATGASLGCGLGHYFQWLDNGRNEWVDADLPEVMALREPLLPTSMQGTRNKTVDLTQPGWWRRLGLPEVKGGPGEQPVLLICEGVLMYLEPGQVHAVLREFANNAPAGSQFVFDAMCWLAIGRAQSHPSVRHTEAQFRWGPRRSAELAGLHPRLMHAAEHRVMEGYGWPYAFIGPTFRRLFGVPFYGIHQMGVTAGGTA